jgi:two-component system, NarL family, invasion response regulator UvrY
MHGEHEYGPAVLRAGAHGYVTKDRPLEELLKALSLLESGQRYISADLARWLAEAEQYKALSAREQQTLKMLADGVPMKEIAWALGVSVKTVSTYRARILEKLRLSSTADLIRYALANDIRR